MRTLSTAFRNHIEGGVTTLCWCWRVTRRDGSVFGFTDHDRDLAFDGTTFEAASGFSASEMKEAVGLSVDNLEVESALSSLRLEEVDIIAGLYDDARIEIFRLNWQQPAERALVRTGSLGEVTRSGSVFRAEVRGLSHYLQQPTGRLYQYACDAALGDHRCTVDLSLAAYRATGSITALLGDRRYAISGASSFDAQWFARGLLTFSSGANTGRSFEIKRHEAAATVVSIELWQAPSAAVSIGDTIAVTAGCDKQPGTCAAKFANMVNFRGFPHMPGNDFVTSVARSGRVRSKV